MAISMQIIVLLILMAASCFFSSAETALFSLSKIEKRRLAEKYPFWFKWVNYHLEHPSRTLSTILIGNLFVNTLAVSMITLFALNYIQPEMLGLVMLAYTIFLILFCEIVPKVFAVRKNDLVSMWVSLPLHAIAFIMLPVRFLARLLAEKILSFLISEKKEKTDMISEDELRILIKIGEEEGVLDAQEKNMIQKIFDLGERPVKSIMIPRIDLVALDIEEPQDRHIETIKKYHFSHLPVYQQSADHILGVISVQEYLLNPSLDIKLLIKPTLFVPETKRIDELLEEIRRTQNPFAVCVDEFGGTAGIVTQEDILEEIFGEYYDEYAKVENPIRSIGHGEYLVEAKVNLTDFNEYFHTHLESQETATLGGFILKELGHVPEKGNEFETEEIKGRIQDMIRQRIKTVVITRKNEL